MSFDQFRNMSPSATAKATPPQGCQRLTASPPPKKLESQKSDGLQSARPVRAA